MTNEHIGGMTREQWQATDAAKATASIACNRCGQQFATPHDFYDHKDKGECMTRTERARARRKGATR